MFNWIGKRVEYSSVSKQLRDSFLKALSTLMIMFTLLLVFTLTITLINKSVFEVYGSGQGDVGNFQLKFNALHSELRYLVYESTSNNQKESIDLIENMTEKLLGEAKSLEVIMVEKESKEIYQTITSLLGEYIPIKDEIVQYEEEAGKYNSIKLYSNEGSNIAEELDASISQLFTYMSGKGAVSSSQTLVISIIITVIGIILGGLVALTSVKSVKKTIIAISDPLEVLTMNAKEIAQGNLHVKISEAGCNEIGVLAHSLSNTVESLNIYVLDISDKLKHIVENDLTIKITQEYEGDFNPIQNSLIKILEFLNNVFTQIGTASKEVLAGAEQVASGSISLAEGTSNQNVAIKEISEEILKISNNAKSNETLCERADLLSRGAKDSAETGKIKMGNMLSSMETINNASKRISSVLKSINDIADQTNLLALNARIEAARAGEAGKGFAVVANEVAKLADKCAAASKESEKMIAATLEAVQKGNLEAKETAEVLKETVENIDIAADVVNAIFDATKKQQQAIEHVSIDITSISDIVHLNSITAEESAAASEQLTAQSDVLWGLIENMKLRKKDEIPLET